MSVLPAAPPVGPGNPPALVEPAFRLPLRATDFDAGIAGLLHSALNGASRAESLADFCGQLARTLRLPLVLLSRRAESGTVAIEATSGESGLWLELQRIPQRWDGGLSSRGPAAAALRAAAAIRMGVQDEGFALWRQAAEAERVRTVVALPVEAADGARVLELYFDGDIPRGATQGTLSVERLARAVATLLADLALVEERALVSRALACAGNATFITDLEGTIVWSNAAFSALSGYRPEEVVGRNPNLLRSGQQGTRYYRDLWGTIRAGKVWRGETVDRGKDGHDYTILQTVSPVARDERITHYVSIQAEIGAERKARERLELASHVSPETGLLTRAAFEGAVAQAFAESPERAAVLAVVSLRGLQRAQALSDDVAGLLATALGKRVRESISEPDLTGSFGPFEYGLLLRGDVSDARVEARLATLREKLSEPMPYLGTIPDIDVHWGVAHYPAGGRTFHDLWLTADRQLANEPYRRARRAAPH